MLPLLFASPMMMISQLAMLWLSSSMGLYLVYSCLAPCLEVKKLSAYFTSHVTSNKDLLYLKGHTE
jgi:hypothetical protein